MYPFTVSYIIFFGQCRIEGQEHQGGRGPYSHRSKREIIILVLANNAITLWEIQAHTVNDHLIFQHVSLSTTSHILNKHQVLIKQYKVQF